MTTHVKIQYCGNVPSGLPQSSKHRVWIDGVDITQSLRKVELDISTGYPVLVKLELYADSLEYVTPDHVVKSRSTKQVRSTINRRHRNDAT